MKNSFSYSGAVLWNSLPWREKLNIWVNLNDWLIRISDFFFKYCVHGIHEKQVLNRLVVDSFAYCLGGLFNFFSIYTPDEFYRVLKKELFCSTKFSLSPSPPPPPHSRLWPKGSRIAAFKEITRARILLMVIQLKISEPKKYTDGIF